MKFCVNIFYFTDNFNLQSKKRLKKRSEEGIYSGARSKKYTIFEISILKYIFMSNFKHKSDIKYLLRGVKLLNPDLLQSVNN